MQDEVEKSLRLNCIVLAEYGGQSRTSPVASSVSTQVIKEVSKQVGNKESLLRLAGARASSY